MEMWTLTAAKVSSFIKCLQIHVGKNGNNLARK